MAELTILTGPVVWSAHDSGTGIGWDSGDGPPSPACVQAGDDPEDYDDDRVLLWADNAALSAWDGDAVARRAAACWNACRGLSTEALEAGAVKAAVIAVQKFHDGQTLSSRAYEAKYWPEARPTSLIGDMKAAAELAGK